MNIWELADEIIEEKENRLLAKRGKSVEKLENEIFDSLRNTLLNAYSKAISSFEQLSEENVDIIREAAKAVMDNDDDIKSLFITMYYNETYFDIIDKHYDGLIGGTELKTEPADYFISEKSIFENATGCELLSIEFDTSVPSFIRFVIEDITTSDAIGILKKGENSIDEKTGIEYSFKNYKHRKKNCKEKEVAVWLSHCIISQKNSRQAIYNVLKKIFPSARVYNDLKLCDANMLIIEIYDMDKYLNK